MMSTLLRYFCPRLASNHQLTHLQGLLGRHASHRFPRWRFVMRHRSSCSREPGKVIWPTAKRQARVALHHGQSLVDHYSWMQAGLTEDVRNYIDQESRMMEILTQETQEFQSWIMRRLEDLESENNSAEMPTVMSGVVYFRRLENDSWRYYRRRTPGNLNTTTAELILDTALLTELYGYPIVLSAVTISPDQNYMAFVVETTASDTFDAHIIELGKNGAKFVDRLNDILSVEFAHDGAVYYTTLKGLRACQVWRHPVGRDVAQDEMILEELDDRFFVDLSHTKDRRYVTVNLNSTTASEVRLLDSLDPDSAASLVCPRQAGIRYFVEHSQGSLYVLTNAGDDNKGEYRLVACPVSESGKPSCLTSSPACRTVYIPERQWHIQDMDVFTEHCVLCAMEGTLPRIVVIPANASKQPEMVQVPKNFCQITPGPNASCTSSSFQFSLASPVRPAANYRLEVKNKSRLRGVCDVSEDVEINPRSEDDVQVGRGEMVCTRLDAVSKDGTLVPVTVFHSDNATRSAGNPMLVFSYGAYGLPLDMSYRQQTALLVELGWVVAYCHVRGGGDLGLHWHRAGRALNKAKSIEDLECCLLTLHQAGFSQPSLTALHGCSAGGLLVAAVCNRAPQLIKAAILEVPYVDVLSTMLDPTLSLTQQETEEWGDPLNDPSSFNCIKSYCPYQNIRCQDYPSMLVTASLADTRVPVWGPLKYVAKLRHTMPSPSPTHNSLYLWVHERSGHFGQFGELDKSRQVAAQVAFLYTSMGLCVN